MCQASENPIWDRAATGSAVAAARASIVTTASRRPDYYAL
jgi:hypothetical protein